MSEKATFLYEGEQITIELTDEFKMTFGMLEETSQSFFLTGKAGTGKSTLLKYFRANTKKNFAVVAFTGLAAINVNGQTIHSFFGFPMGFIDTSKIRPNEVLKELLGSLDTLIIDEVSMLRADMMDAIDKSLRINRRDSHKPFGGIQLVMVGDMYQLPPIVEKELKDVYGRYYDTPYFFSADVFKHLSVPLITLQTVHRQTDPTFINILNCIRERKNVHSALAALNQHVKYDFNELKEGETVMLTTTNEKARELNSFFLTRIQGLSYSFEAVVTGEFDPKSYPTDATLYFKEGAKVMFIKNDGEKQYVNGDVGIITKISPFSIEVKCRGSRFNVKRAVWEKYKYKHVPSEMTGAKGSVEKQSIGSFEQYPLRLAWAVTIHKSQGQTYNKVFIDMHKGSFTSGQTYVALSRCKSLEGISLQRPIEDRDVILDERIQKFAEKFVEL